MILIAKESNFQKSVESNPGLPWFCFTSRCNWSRKLAPLSKPIRCITKTKQPAFSCFPVFRKLAPFSQPIRCKTKTKQPAFSRASGSMGVFTLSFHWLLKVCSFHLTGCCDYFGFDFNDTQPKSVPTMITLTQAARHGALKTYAFLGQAQSTE